MVTHNTDLIHHTNSAYRLREGSLVEVPQVEYDVFKTKE